MLAMVLCFGTHQLIYIVQVLLALERIEQDEELTYEVVDLCVKCVWLFPAHS